MNRHLRMRIEIDAYIGRPCGSGEKLIESALQELVNKHDFRVGRITSGRVVSIGSDYENQRVDVYVNSQWSDPD